MKKYFNKMTMRITYNENKKENTRYLLKNITFAERHIWQMLKGNKFYGFDSYTKNQSAVS